MSEIDEKVLEDALRWETLTNKSAAEGLFNPEHYERMNLSAFGQSDRYIRALLATHANLEAARKRIVELEAQLGRDTRSVLFGAMCFVWGAWR